jgi:predicted DNA-binding protein (UPF0251 family)
MIINCQFAKFGNKESPDKAIINKKISVQTFIEILNETGKKVNQCHVNARFVEILE